jgi:esterase/lipase superfamily enzyme
MKDSSWAAKICLLVCVFTSCCRPLPHLSPEARKDIAGVTDSNQSLKYPWQFNDYSWDSIDLQNLDSLARMDTLDFKVNYLSRDMEYRASSNFVYGHFKNSASIQNKSGKLKWISQAYYRVPVLYVTNRKRSGSKCAIDFYSCKAENTNEYGIVQVTIPKNGRSPGQINIRQWWELLSNPYDKKKYFTIDTLKALTEARFYDVLKSALTYVDSDEIFVFIHGYNTKFIDAAYRTAQLFFDLDYKGVPIMYCWPSMGEEKGYLYDLQQADRSAFEVRKFLATVARKNCTKKINIIAHSMGNRVFSRAMSELSYMMPDVRFNHIIMAAPDIDDGDFRANYASKMIKMCKDITLYSSSEDLALWASKKAGYLNRLGQSGPNLFVMRPITTIDVSEVNCDDIIGHSCFARSKKILEDIHNLLSEKQLKDRKLENVRYRTSQDYYYRLPR